MAAPTHPQTADKLRSLPGQDPQYAVRFIDNLLDAACEIGASDVHLQPVPSALEIRWRLDGVLQPVGTFSRGESTDVVSRLKVLADLLTYRTDIPQEGRLRQKRGEVEVRVSTFPTLHGERAVIRLFASQGTYLLVEDLQLPPPVQASLTQSLEETAGAIVICGPAGSGKTTTAYACLREIVRRGGGSKSLVSLEDPIEVAVEGVAQAQVNPAADFNLAAGLRSLMRQDPEVILVGEIRDRETAAASLQAALTGHLVLTTFHSGSAAGAIGRLMDMDLETFQIRNGISTVLCQRLARRLCHCAIPVVDETEKLQLPVHSARRAQGCPQCLQTGYRGRLLIAELLPIGHPAIAKAMMAGRGIDELGRAAVEAGFEDLPTNAARAVEAGHTSPAEVRRVLGFGHDSPRS